MVASYLMNKDIWAIISFVMDTFLTVFVLQSQNDSTQCIPVLTWTWTKVWPFRYFSIARYIFEQIKAKRDVSDGHSPKLLPI